MEQQHNNLGEVPERRDIQKYLMYGLQHRLMRLETTKQTNKAAISKEALLYPRHKDKKLRLVIAEKKMENESALQQCLHFTLQGTLCSELTD